MPEQISNQIEAVEKFILMTFLSTPDLIVTQKTKKEEKIIFTDGSQITEKTQVEIITPTIDYEYLKSELAKNPFKLIQNIQDIYLPYIYYLTKDARAALWKNDIERVQKILTRIQKVKDIFAIMKENTLHIMTPTQFDRLLSSAQLCFYFPLGNKIILSRFFNSQTETNEYLSRKIPTQLREAHRVIFYRMIKSSYRRDKPWKSTNAVIENITNRFNAQIRELIESNTSNFARGRKTFIQLYTTIQKKLKKELKENRALTIEQRSNANQWLKNIEQLIIEQRDYQKKEFEFLRKYAYSERILTEWLKQNKKLKKRVIKAQ
jgi:hypothetical protein